MVSRILPIENGHNFRELGGYQTLDGKTLKTKRLLRTANLADLSPKDLALLNSYNVSVDIDLRSKDERQQAPDKVPVSAKYKSVPIFKEDQTESTTTEAELYQRYTNNPLGGQMQMQKVYQELVQDEHSIKMYRQFFEILLQQSADNQATLFHCTGGKDRTGMAAYYLLNALNVPEPVIRQDYLLTNTASQQHIAQRMSRLAAKHASSGFIKSTHALMSVQSAYLDTAITTIKQNWGSTQNYLQTALKLSKSDINQLRATYLN